MTTPNYALSLAIPHYNEESNVPFTIPSLFDEFKKHKIALQIVAVDNGSSDGTLNELQRLKSVYPDLLVASSEKNLGYGGGIALGWSLCTGDYIGFTCADSQIRPADIVNMFKKIQNTSLDIIKGCRIKREDGLLREIYSYVFNVLLRFIFRINVKDVNGYPLILKNGVLKKMRIKSRDWMINVELLTKARLLRAGLEEQNLTFYKRSRGKTSVNLLTVLFFLLQIIKFANRFYFSKEYRSLRSR